MSAVPESKRQTDPPNHNAAAVAMKGISPARPSIRAGSGMEELLAVMEGDDSVSVIC